MLPIGVQENIIIIRDPSETNRPDRIPSGDRHACLETHWRHQHALSETVMLYQRPTCLWSPSETNMPAESNRNLNTYIFKYTYFYILFAYLCSFHVNGSYWQTGWESRIKDLNELLYFLISGDFHLLIHFSYLLTYSKTRLC